MRFRFNDYCLDLARRELRQGANLVAIEPQVFDIIAFLIQNRERVVSKDDLIATVWSGRIVVRLRAYKSASTPCARRLVRKTPVINKTFVRTIPRRGFRFVGSVIELLRRRRHQVSPALTGGLHVAGDSRLATATGEWREIEPTYREPGWLAPPDFLRCRSGRSIVVLPLDVLHADEDSRLLADALIHDIIRLGRLRWLFVIARGTAFAFRGQNQDPREISRKLGVGFVLQGSAQFHDKRIQLNVALSDALSSGELLG